MNQTSTHAAIATVIAAYCGLAGMIGFLLFATRNKKADRLPRRQAPVARVEPRANDSVTVGAQLVGPRRAADDVVKTG